MARLTALTGPGAGREYTLAERLVMGRDQEEVDLHVDDARASRLHAEVARKGDRYVLRDLGSLNRTFVNGLAVEETTLRDGDTITIGQCRLLFRDKASAIRLSGPGTTSLRMVIDSSSDAEAGASEIVEISAAGEVPMDAEQLQDLRTAQGVYKQLNAVLETATALGSAASLNEVFALIMEKLLDALPAADRAFLMLLDDQTNELRLSAARTRRGETGGEVVLSRTIVNKVIGERRGVLSADTRSEDEFSRSASIAALSIQTFMCCPLLYRNKTLGILQVDSRGSVAPFVEADLRLLCSLASQVALAIQNTRDERERQLLYLENVGSLVKAIEARDEYTRGHSMRVSDYSMLTARRLNERPDVDERIGLDRLRCASQLHDVGKIGVPQSVLHKPGSLTEDEYELMKRHPVTSYYILSGMRVPSDIKGMEVIAALHHERVDGRGYPCGFSGAGIPIEARILAVADAFDAMSSDRPYREAMEVNEAAEQVRQGAGTQFDADVAQVFLALLEEGAFDGVIGEHTKGQLATFPGHDAFVELMAKLVSDPGSTGWRPET